MPAGIATALALLGDSSLYAVLPTHPLDAGISLAAVGVILSANRFVRVLTNGPVGWLSDLWPRRRVFVPALFVGAMSTAIYGLATGFWPLLLGRLAWGLAWSGIWVAGNAIVLDIAEYGNRGRMVGIFNAFFFAGFGLGAIIGGILTDWLGYRPTFVVEALLSLGGALFAALVLPETRHLRGSGDTPQSPRAKDPSSIRHRRSKLLSAMGLMSINRLLMAGLLIPTLGVLLLESQGATITIAGRSFGVATVTGVGLGATTLIAASWMPVAGALSDRLRTRWGVAAAGLAVGVIGFGLLAAGDPWALLLGISLTALASGSNQSLSIAVAGDLSHPDQRGRVMGVLFTTGDLASAVGPLGAFALIQLVDVSDLYWAAAALFAVMFLVAAWWAGESASRPLGAAYERKRRFSGS